MVKGLPTGTGATRAGGTAARSAGHQICLFLPIRSACPPMRLSRKSPMVETTASTVRTTSRPSASSTPPAVAARFSSVIEGGSPEKGPTV